jgi:hypothetical protein
VNCPTVESNKEQEGKEAAILKKGTKPKKN